MDVENVKENIIQIADDIVYPLDSSERGYLIFSRTEGFYLGKEQYELLINSVKKLNLSGEIFCLDIEGIDCMEKFHEIDAKDIFSRSLDKITGQDLRNITDFDYSEYEEILLLFENCIIDGKMRWSVCVYQDFWGIVYGPTALLDDLVKKYDFEKDAKCYEEDIRDEVHDEEARKGLLELSRQSYIWKCSE